MLLARGYGLHKFDVESAARADQALGAAAGMPRPQPTQPSPAAGARGRCAM